MSHSWIRTRWSVLLDSGDPNFCLWGYLLEDVQKKNGESDERNRLTSVLLDIDVGDPKVLKFIFLFRCQRLWKKMEMLTAVMAGDRSFELRVFLEGSMSPDHETVLTRRLCRLVNTFHEDWKRWVWMIYVLFCKDYNLCMILRYREIYIDNKARVAGYRRLRTVMKKSGLRVLMIDRSNCRYFDLYCE